MQHKDVFLLETIIEFCDRIIKNTKDNNLSYDTFKNNLDLIDQCAFRIEQIGENAGDLSEQFRESHSEIEWHKIIGFRNIIAHAYGTINSLVLWDIVKNDIPRLRDYCARLIGAK